MPDLIARDKALIFRIVHRDNLPSIIENGLHCRNSGMIDPNFQTIGNRDLIEKRQDRKVPIPPGGTLGDYVPFYFTPYSPMLYNIKTGYNEVVQRSNDEIVILVSSLPRLKKEGVAFVFTDRHAYLRLANYYSDLTHLDEIDWPRLRARNFRRDLDDPEGIERYQAEALIHRHLPFHSLLGVACHSEPVKTELERKTGLDNVRVRPDWYFR